jgi:glycosyltransferase involved in cell wall biosynthesis
MCAVSIITPCFNGARYLDALCGSLRAQTLTNWEHIVVDDGSTDNTASTVERLMTTDPRLRLVRTGNGGVARARKAGYRASNPLSRYVYFLDADDLLEPDMLRVMVDYLDRHPRVGLAFCGFTCIDDEGRELPDIVLPRYVPTRFGVRELEPDEPETPLVSIYCWAPVMESLSVLRREVYALTDGWDESMGQGGEGVDLFVQVAFHSEVHFVNQRLYRYRRHGAQASHDSARLQRQDLRVQIKWRDRRCDLPPGFRALIDDAQAFRTGRLRLHLSLASGFRYLRRAEVRHAATCFLDSVRTASRMMRRESPWPLQMVS